MATEQNIAQARRFVMEHNQAGYAASFDALLSAECIVHEYLPGLPDELDRAGYEQFISMFRGALPDIHNSIEDVIAAEDKVVIRWTGYGTHTGAELMGIPAGGKALTAHGIYILRFEDEKIVELWDNWDNLNVLQQLGGLPAPR